jgi:hypothetical protein
LPAVVDVCDVGERVADRRRSLRLSTDLRIRLVEPSCLVATLALGTGNAGTPN